LKRKKRFFWTGGKKKKKKKGRARGFAGKSFKGLAS